MSVGVKFRDYFYEQNICSCECQNVNPQITVD